MTSYRLACELSDKIAAIAPVEGAQDIACRPSNCFWVERGGCSSESEHSKNSGARVSIYSGCKDGTGVAMYAVEGGRHMWPGRRINGNAVPDSGLMWGFFVQHPKQSVAIRLD